MRLRGAEKRPPQPRGLPVARNLLGVVAVRVRGAPLRRGGGLRRAARQGLRGVEGARRLLGHEPCEPHREQLCGDQPPAPVVEVQRRRPLPLPRGTAKRAPLRLRFRFDRRRRRGCILAGGGAAAAEASARRSSLGLRRGRGPHGVRLRAVGGLAAAEGPAELALAGRSALISAARRRAPLLPAAPRGVGVGVLRAGPPPRRLRLLGGGRGAHGLLHRVARLSGLLLGDLGAAVPADGVLRHLPGLGSAAPLVELRVVLAVLLGEALGRVPELQEGVNRNGEVVLRQTIVHVEVEDRVEELQQILLRRVEEKTGERQKLVAG
mmetsp:Transcript_39643/g.110086  ORF Transcript_39643/g.110086 Transcript_39643/m.110086 type:complete len:322 (-) Transcript_39643:519-1484(-)